VGPRTGLDGVEKRKFLNCRESNPGRPVRGYTDRNKINKCTRTWAEYKEKKIDEQERQEREMES
jgi:hypothetical protein